MVHWDDKGQTLIVPAEQGGIIMRCGEKCFYVKIDKNNRTETLPVYARTTAEARTTVRRELGKQTSILSVRERK